MTLSLYCEAPGCELLARHDLTLQGVQLLRACCHHADVGMLHIAEQHADALQGFSGFARWCRDHDRSCGPVLGPVVPRHLVPVS